MNTELMHLQPEQIEELMKRYYSGETATKLISEFNIHTTASNLYRVFPPEEFLDYKCEYCGNILVAKRPSKSNINLPRYEKDLFCPKCNHKQYTTCRCQSCKNAEIRRNDERLENIKEAFSGQIANVTFDELSFLEKVYTGTLCRAYLRENMFEISPHDEMSNVILTPTKELQIELYNVLIKSKVIRVSPNSAISAFDFDENNFPKAYSMNKVAYNINLKMPLNKNDLFLEILNPTYYSEINKDDAFELWKKIAVAECIEYLEHRLKSVGFDFSAGEKTYTTFEILLQDFSVSQIYGIIWREVANASKLYLEKSISKSHAANSVIGACQRYGERAKINKWDLKRYVRERTLPQSELSLFYFNKVLKIGDMGFDMPPCII